MNTQWHGFTSPWHGTTYDVKRNLIKCLHSGLNPIHGQKDGKFDNSRPGPPGPPKPPTSVVAAWAALAAYVELSSFLANSPESTSLWNGTTYDVERNLIKCLPSGLDTLPSGMEPLTMLTGISLNTYTMAWIHFRLAWNHLRC